MTRASEARRFSFCRIAHADVDQLAASVAAAFTRYRSFAPPQWRPPATERHGAALRRRLGNPDFWGELATEAQALAGHATFLPAAQHSFRTAAGDGLAHLGHLFVEPPYWGSRVATQLLAHATSAAQCRGFAAMRLFVPAHQARARRFYEREGFGAVGDCFEFAGGLSVLEYRRAIEHASR